MHSLHSTYFLQVTKGWCCCFCSLFSFLKIFTPCVCIYFYYILQYCCCCFNKHFFVKNIASSINHRINDKDSLYYVLCLFINNYVRECFKFFILFYLRTLYRNRVYLCMFCVCIYIKFYYFIIYPHQLFFNNSNFVQIGSLSVQILQPCQCIDLCKLFSH